MAGGELRPRARLRQLPTSPRSTAGWPEASTSRWMRSLSRVSSSRIAAKGCILTTAATLAGPLPEVRLQRRLAPPRRDLRQGALVVRVVRGAAPDEVFDLLQAVARLGGARRPQVRRVRKHAHARHERVPGEHRVA